jgi:3-oxoacyl-[acyl-carrier protein] reductase
MAASWKATSKGDKNVDLGIAGKVAVVTGGSGGIGRAISEELGRNGCKVVVVARGQEQIDATVAAIKSEGGAAVGVVADITSLDSFPYILEQAKAAFGVPEIAIWQPVAPPSGAFDEYTDADFESAFSNIVKCFANFARTFSPGMKEKKWGRIVTIGSGHGRLPGRRDALGFDYVLANTLRPAGLGLSRSLADDLASYGITVNTIPPGFIETGEQYKSFFERCAKAVNMSYDAFMARLIKHIPVGRFGTAEEVGSLCCFLCSQSASYITGQYILVDGGHMQHYY